MDRTAVNLLHARATDLLSVVLSHADCAAMDGDSAVVAARIPFDVLDDAFAVLGALEDLEEQHDREADYACTRPHPVWGAVMTSGFSDAEPSMGWSNPGYDRAASWAADGSPVAWDNEQ
jgi:hypothetical protein